MALDIAKQRFALCNSLNIAVQVREIQQLLAKLQTRCKIETIDKADFNPHEHKDQPCIHSNVFQFNNYHLDLHRMSLAFRQAGI